MTKVMNSSTARQVVADFENLHGYFETWEEYRKAIDYAEYWYPEMLKDEDLAKEHGITVDEYAQSSILNGIYGAHHMIEEDGFIPAEITVEERAERIVSKYEYYVKEYGSDPLEDREQALQYAIEKLPSLLKSKKKTVEAEAEEAIVLAFQEGTYKTAKAVEPEASEDQTEDPEPTEQEIIEVDQESVKKALKALTVSKEGIGEKIAQYYAMHEKFNKQFFGGQLSHPLITVDKINNKTLGNYTEGKDIMNLENHIRLNINFIALNPDKRVLETLVHEMIHQWQDEVLYVKKGEEAKTVKVPVTEKVPGPDKDKYRFTGEWVEIKQKRRPKDWHNRDFKDMACVVGIPAKGDKCYGNPAKMPEAKSYNRRFECGCIASNGYPLSIWSTRPVFATCNICEQPFREKKKGGELIEVKQSHVERPGENAIEQEMLLKYMYFMHFKTREERIVFVEDLAHQGLTNLVVEDGVYQKEHNAYKDGFRYWVAYNADEKPKPEIVEVPKEAKKEKRKKATKQDQVKAKEVEAVKTPSEEVVVPEVQAKQRSHENPADLIELYRELGSLKAIAELFGIANGTITYQKKKHQIDFGKGTYVDNGETKSV